MDLKSDIFNIEKVRSASKQPPAVVEVEKEIIGAMLLDNEAIPKVFEILKADSFFDPKHKVIFHSIQSLYEANEPLDTVTLYEELKKLIKYSAILALLIMMFALSQITAPAGAAKTTARHKTINVRSIRDV